MNVLIKCCKSWSLPYGCLTASHLWRDFNLESSSSVQLLEHCEDVGRGAALGHIAPKSVGVVIVHKPEIQFWT